VLKFSKPEVVEVACCYGKTTLYLAAAAKRQDGFVSCVDIAEYLWEGRSAADLLRQADLLDICRITFGRDARWYLLDLLRQRPGQWIDLAYLDLTHTVEVDSFAALALWTHMRPGGILVFDDLNWVPAVHGSVYKDLSEPNISNVQVIFDYISGLSDAAERAEWGQEEVAWRWGLLRKRDIAGTNAVPLRKLLRGLE
jgi:predicted O-methyltransferase YrrM